MLAVERYRYILSAIQSREICTVGELSSVLQVAEETIRRDIKKLEEDGLLVRIHGGAIRKSGVSLNEDIPFNVRYSQNSEGKKKIAALAARLLEDKITLMMDASSTTLFMMPHIQSKKNVSIVTNSLEIIYKYADSPSLRLISTGGRPKKNGLSLVGHAAMQMISLYYVDVLFMSCKALDLARGVMDSNEWDSEIKKKMMQQAKQVYLLADHQKFNQISFSYLSDITGFDGVITDKEPSEAWIKTLAEKNVSLMFPSV